MSTTDELHRWFLAREAGEVLSSESVDELWSAQVEVGDCFGFGIETCGEPIVEHDGSNRYSFAHVALWPESRRFVGYPSNGQRRRMPGLLWQIDDAL